MLSFPPADVTSAADVRRVVGHDGPATSLTYLALPPSCCPPCSGARHRAARHRRRRRDREAVRHRPGFGAEPQRDPAPVQLRGRRSSGSTTSCPTSWSAGCSPFGSSTGSSSRSWNAAHVERVDIHWLESLTLEGRASYYDGAGAMKDMLQNHLMEAMALVLMEQPARLDAASFRDVRVEALRSVPTPARRAAATHATVRARYTAGSDRHAVGPVVRRRARGRPPTEHRDVRRR